MTKAERTKQFIIEKTAPVFNKNGYAGTSINDLTEATGLTRGSIYGNFENKDEVALAAFDYNYNKMQELIAQQMQAGLTAPDKLRAYAAAFAGLFKTPSLQYGCPVLNTATEADDTHSGLRQKVVKAIDEWCARIEAIVNKGKNNKQLKKSVDAREFAFAFVALIEGGVMLSKATGKTEALNAALKQVRRMIKEIEK